MSGRLRIGELFAGYGGLGMGVQQVIDADVAWFSEFDPPPSKILAHHWPDIPNHGDITKIDWSTVEPVDILTGGFPCQDVSLAGARRGLKDGTRSGLWSEFARAIDELRPQLVVIENVRGLLSAEASRNLELDPWALGDRGARSTLRALGAVLGDLAELGYDAEWCGVRAADAGAPHGRYRVFIIAYPQGQPRGVGHGDDVRPGSGTVGRLPDSGRGAYSDTRGEAVGLGAGLRESEPARIGRGRPDDDSLQDIVADSHDGDRDGWQREARRVEERGDAVAGRGNVAAADSDDPADDWEWTRTEPWYRIPVVADAGSERLREHAGESSSEEAGTASGHFADGAGGWRSDTDWGPYRAAVKRWERATGRIAPAPTNADGKSGQHRLAAQFVEWMMGLPHGHVTDPAIGLSRNEQLKALGNGVVPQQAALAVAFLLRRSGWGLAA